MRMEFETLGRRERTLLLRALNFEIHNLVCRYCKEKTTYYECGIMPATGNDKNATIICNSPLCMSSYLEEIKFKES